MRKTGVSLWIGLLFAIVMAASACGGDSGITETEEPDAGASDGERLTGSAPAPDDGPAPEPTAAAPEGEGAAGSAPAPDDQPPQESAPSSPTAAAEPTPAPPAGRTGDEKLAPELVGISGWVNTDPFNLQELRGNVVLIDFWTYTCINCIRTLPYIREWHEKYKDVGLVIVGVHTPEFDFEKDHDNVVEAAEKFQLNYRIAQDNLYDTWRAYDNHYWPAKYLIDRDGYIRYSHFGEGSYAETEEKIRELLAEGGGSVGGIDPNLDPERQIDGKAYLADGAAGPTRELYAGYQRNYGILQSQGAPPYVMNREYYEGPDESRHYIDPGEHLNHFLYLQGYWLNGPESLVHARATPDYDDYIGLMFFATTLNAVMSPEAAKPYDVRVTMDGRPLDASSSGADIRFDDEGNSYVVVDEPRMYGLVELPEFGGHELTLSSNSKDFNLFAFTFGAYVTDRDS